jgi:hypothetical protein
MCGQAYQRRYFTCLSLAKKSWKIVASMQMRYSCGSALKPQDTIDLPVLAGRDGDSLITGQR